MDAFKLLSRSTTLKKSNRKITGIDVPSSGSNNNPQIFGKDSLSLDRIDVSTEAVNGKKRKRKHFSPKLEESLQAVNFFDGNNANGSFQDHDGYKTGKQVRYGEADTSSNVVANINIARMSEEERRRVLKLHKIKVVKLENIDHKARHSQQRSRKKVSAKHAEPVAHTSKIPIFHQPLMSFAEMEPRFGIDRRLAGNLTKQAYSIPTEVQLAGIPLLLPEKHTDIAEVNEASNFSPGLDNIDLLTVAPTGSGKTLAFLIPLIQSLLKDRKSGFHRQGAKAVILAPTKELASQIRNEAKKLIAITGLKATLVRKGLNIMHHSDVADVKASHVSKEPKLSNVRTETEALSSDEEDMKNQLKGANGTKADILVATPMALLNAINTSDTKSSSLSSIKYLILDEADILLDPLFREQTLSIWMACTNQALRVSLWSATMGSSIEELAISILNSRLDKLNESNSTAIIRAPLLRLVIGLKDSAVPTITHKLVYAATEQGKLMALRQLLHPTAPAGNSDSTLRPPFLVFTQSIPRAIALHSELVYDIPPEAGGSTRIAVLHSDLSDTARDRIMTRFRAGETWVLITTDLLSRGVDFRGVNGVVNYDVPNSSAAYVHRAGRTGRAGREGGIAVTLYTKEDIPNVKNVANVIAASEKLRKGGGGGGNNNSNSSSSNGKRSAASDVSEWLLDALPTPTKREKKSLKKRGVEARRSATNSSRISTKSGFERRLDNNKKGVALKRHQRGVASVDKIQNDHDNQGNFHY